MVGELQGRRSAHPFEQFSWFPAVLAALETASPLQKKYCNTELCPVATGQSSFELKAAYRVDTLVWRVSLDHL